MLKMHYRVIVMFAFLEYRNTGIAKQCRYWRPDSWLIAEVRMSRISWAQYSIRTRFSWSVCKILCTRHLLECPNTE